MGEPGRRIAAGNRLDGEANRFLERLLGAGAQPTSDRLELGDGLLNGGSGEYGGRNNSQQPRASITGIEAVVASRPRLAHLAADLAYLGLTLSYLSHFSNWTKPS